MQEIRRTCWTASYGKWIKASDKLQILDLCWLIQMYSSSEYAWRTVGLKWVDNCSSVCMRMLISYLYSDLQTSSGDSQTYFLSQFTACKVIPPGYFPDIITHNPLCFKWISVFKQWLQSAPLNHAKVTKVAVGVVFDQIKFHSWHKPVLISWCRCNTL